MKAIDKQVQGTHYKNLAIQPIEYIHANNIPYIEGNVIKYISRWRSKNGLQDLEKARHYIEMLIEFEQAKSERACLDCHHEALCDLYDKCQKGIRANDT